MLKSSDNDELKKTLYKF